MILCRRHCEPKAKQSRAAACALALDCFDAARLAMTGEREGAGTGSAGAVRLPRGGFRTGGALAHRRAVAGSGDGLRLVSARSEEHTSELQSLMRISYAVFCLKNKKRNH